MFRLCAADAHDRRAPGYGEDDGIARPHAEKLEEARESFDNAVNFGLAESSPGAVETSLKKAEAAARKKKE